MKGHTYKAGYKGTQPLYAEMFALKKQYTNSIVFLSQDVIGSSDKCSICVIRLQLPNRY
jgi:hypothetical protein